METTFSAAVTADITRARQHAVGDLLHRTARRYPDKLAVVDGDLRVTYDEFDLAVNRAAHALADRDLAKGDRLALLSHNCWQYAVLDFATARLGVVLVPVNFMLGADEIAYILDHSGAETLVAEDALAEVGDAAIRAPAASMPASASGTSASSATIAVAPECSRMNAISEAPSMKFTGTSTTPSRAVA